MENQTSQKLDRIFYALSSPARREMVHLVARRAQTVSELAEPFSMSLAAVSKHVKVLEEAGIFRGTVEGRTHTCSVNSEALSLATGWLHFYERLWSDQFDALERALGEWGPGGGKET